MPASPSPPGRSARPARWPVRSGARCSLSRCRRSRSNTSTSSSGSPTNTSRTTSTFPTPRSGRLTSRRSPPPATSTGSSPATPSSSRVGATALVARFVGAGDWRLARHATGQAVVLAIVFGALGSVAGLVGLPYLVELLQLTGDAADYCTAFLNPLAALLVVSDHGVGVRRVSGRGRRHANRAESPGRRRDPERSARLDALLRHRTVERSRLRRHLARHRVESPHRLRRASRDPRARQVRAEAVAGRSRPGFPAHPAASARERPGRDRQPVGRRVPVVVPLAS